MSTAALVFVIIAVCLAGFGIAFIALGMSNERAYWSQRDPSGDARQDATRLSSVIRSAGRLAAGEVRAPLRVAAIGVLMCYLAAGFALVGVLVSL